MVRAKLASYDARALEDNSADASRLDPPAEVAEVTRPVMRSRRVQPLQPETRRARRGDARRFAAQGRATGSVTRDPARGRASELDMARRRRTHLRGASGNVQRERFRHVPAERRNATRAFSIVLSRFADLPDPGSGFLTGRIRWMDLGVRLGQFVISR